MKKTPECACLDGIFHQSADGVTFSVTVQPRSSRCSLEGVQGSALRVKLTKPPVEGEANDECCRFVAGLLGMPKSRVSILKGAASRHKVLYASGISENAAISLIADALHPVSRRNKHA